jgi:tetratricopeptide (TPR) repeat protein
MSTDINQLLQRARELNAHKEYKAVYEMLPWEFLKSIDNTELLYEAGFAAENIREFRDAALFYRHASSSTANPLITDALAGRGRIGNLAGRYKDAVKYFTQAIQRDPANSEYYYGRGYAYRYLKNCSDEAISDLTKAIELDPHYVTAIRGRGDVFLSTEQYDDALRDFNQAIALQPDMEGAYNERGLAWYYKNEFDKALNEFDTALSLNPNMANTWYNKGSIWQEKKEYAKAIADLNRAIELSPDAEYMYVSRADCWLMLKAYDEAIADYAQSVRLIFDQESSWQKLGAIFNEQPKYQLQDCQYPVDLDMETAVATFFVIGFVSYHLKDYYEARNAFHKAIFYSFDDDVTYFEEWKKKAEARILEAPDTMCLRQIKREQAAAFLEEIRTAYAQRFKLSTDGFINDPEIKSWDDNYRPIEAGIQGWLPAFRPDIAQWALDQPTEFGGTKLVVATHNNELFYPSLVGIPIADVLWDQITKGPNELDGQFVGRVKKFDRMGKVLDEYAIRIREGLMDSSIVFEEPQNDEQAKEQAMLKSILFL